jgi:pyoverdine/dityrosine biosynthesis protein Dit1
MKYKTGDKISIKNVDFTIEIVARYPGAQAAVISQFLGNSNYYRVMLDGLSTYMSEPVLDLLIENMAKKEIEAINAKREADKRDSHKRENSRFTKNKRR